MAQRLAGKVAVVTGGSRGIGRAIAEAYAREGALVAFTYVSNEKAAAETVRAIEAGGGKAFAVHADVSKVAAIRDGFKKLDAELVARTGKREFDILVNNAGVAASADFQATTEEIFDKNFTTNVKGLFFTTQEAEKRLRDGGRVINISSAVTRIVFAGLSSYAATKGAVNTLTLQLAPLLGERNITVNAIAPGAIDTDINAAWLKNPDAQKGITTQQALHRLGKAEDIAGAALLLALPESGWITGQVLDASGGFKLT